MAQINLTQDSSPASPGSGQAAISVPAGTDVKIRIEVDGGNDYTLTIPATGIAALLGVANTFTANQTIDAGSGESRLTLADQSAAGEYSTIRMLTGNAKYAWLFGAQNNVNNGVEITPSTATGGSTFSTPVFRLLQSGHLLINTATDEGVLVLGTPTDRFAVVDATTTGSTKSSPGTVDAWKEVKIGGSTYYMPAYTSKTS